MLGYAGCQSAALSDRLRAGPESDNGTQPVGFGKPPGSYMASPSAVLDSTTDPAAEAPAGSVSLTMQGPPPVFRPVALTVTAGEMIFFLNNRSPLVPHGRHNLAIGHSLGDPLVVSELVDGSDSATFTVYGLEPGEYVTWRTFPIMRRWDRSDD